MYRSRRTTNGISISLHCHADGIGAAIVSTGSIESVGSHRIPERSRIAGVPKPPAATTTRSAVSRLRPDGPAVTTPTARPPSISIRSTRVPERTFAPRATAASRNRRASHLIP